MIKTLKVDKMLPIKVGENKCTVVKNLFLLFLLNLVELTSNKKILIVRSHEIAHNSRNVIPDNTTATSRYLTTSDNFERPLKINYTTNLIVDKSDIGGHQKPTYSNHRMIVDNDNKSITTKNDLDGGALDSILRPQLAVQIYTNSPADHHTQVENSDSPGSQSKQNNIASTKFSSARLIVPVSQLQQQNQYQHNQMYNDDSRGEELLTSNHKTTSNLWHYFTEQTPNSSNSINDNNNPDSKEDFYNHQEHYGTNETPVINAIITVPHSSHSSNLHQTATTINKHNANNHSRYQRRHHQYDSTRQQTNLDNTNLSSSMIPQILDDQANGNIEISMNLNGNEIIIDPVSKFGRVVSINSSREVIGDEEQNQRGDTNNNGNIQHEQIAQTGQQKYSTIKQDKGSSGSSRMQQNRSMMDKTLAGINKALRKHVSSDLAGGDQQSASEIDQVNNNNGYYSDGKNNKNSDNNDIINDNSDNDDLDNDNDISFIRTSTTTTTNTMNSDRDDQDIETNSKPKLKDIDDEIKRDEKSSGSRNNRFWSDDNNSLSDKDVNVGGRDIQTTDESSRDDRLSSNPYYQQNNQRLVDKKIDHDNIINRRHVKRFNKPSLRQQSVLIANDGSKKASSSKRRLSYKSDGRDSSSNNSGIDSDRASGTERDRRRIIVDNNHDSNEKVSPVIIKGEDVRKFEQLLENLRALSLNNLAAAKPKRINTNKNNKGISSSSSSQDNSGSTRSSHFEDSDGQNNRSEPDDQSASQNAQAKIWNNDQDHDNRQSTNNQAKNNDISLIDSECDRRNRQQQLLQKSASDDEPAFEPDSAPNIVDQDPMTSSDGNDDLNDEGSQNIEREQQSGADMYNKLGGIINHSTTNGNREQNINQDRNSNQLDEPKTLFVRQTILQNYYDHINGDDYRNGVVSNESDDFDTIHRSNHEARHRENSDYNDSASANNRRSVRRSARTINGEFSQMVDNHYSHNHQQQEIANSSITGDKTQSSSSNDYIDYNQLDDRTVSQEADIVSRDKMPSREQLNHMRNLQHLIEKAAIGGSLNDKSTMNLIS